MAIGYRIADGYLEIVADTDKADRQILQFFRSTDGKLRDMRGRFASEGNLAGRGFARELERGAGGGKGGKDDGLFGGLLGKVAGFGRTAGGLFINGFMGKAVLGLAALPTVISAATAAIQGAVQIGGAVGALAPAAIGAAVLAIGTLKVAFSGIGKALKAGLAGDMEKFAEATKNMAPAMREVVGEMVKLNPLLKDLKQTVQQSFWAPMISQVSALGQTYLPLLRNVMSEVAQSFGQSFSQIITFLNAGPTAAGLGAAFRDIAQAIGNVAAGLPGIVQGLTTLFTVGADFLPNLTGDFDQLTQRFAEWMAMLADTGRLQAFISGGLQLVGDLAKAFGDILGILRSISEAVPSGGGLFSALGQLLSMVNQFFASFQGQEILSSFFAKLQAIGQIIIQLVSAALPGLMALSDGLISGLQALLPAAQPVGEALGAIAKAIAPLLPVVGGILAAAFQFLATILQVVAAELGPFISLLGELANGVLAQLTPLLTEFAKDALPAVVEGGKQIAAAFAPAIPIFIQVAQAISQGLLDALPQLISLSQQAIPIFVEVAQTLGPMFAENLKMLLPHIPLLVSMLVALFQIIVVVGNVFLSFLPIVADVVAFFGGIVRWVTDFVLSIAEVPLKLIAMKDSFLDFISGTWDSIVNWFTSVVTWFSQLPDQIWQWLSQLPQKIIDAFSSMASASLYWIGFMAGSIIKFFMDLPGQIWGFLSSLPSIIGNAFSSAWEWVKSTTSAAVSAVAGFLSSLPSRAAAALGSLWGAISGGVTSAWNSLKNSASQAVTATVNFVTQLPGRLKAIFSGAGSWLVSAGSDMIRGLANGIENALGWAVDKAKAAASRIAQGFKDALGIKSPSKVMAEEVGRWIPPGIQQGIQASMPALTGYVEGAARGLVTAATAPVVSVAAPNVSVGGATVTLMVDGEEIAAKVVTPDRVAAATAEGSRRRAYLNTGRPAIVGGAAA